jgi:predicted ester cyclase
MVTHTHNSDHPHAAVHDAYADKYTENNLDELDEVLHPELQLHEFLGVETTVSFEEYTEERAPGLRNAFPDVEFVNRGHIIDGDMIATQSVMTGTHEGDILGVPGSGTEVEIPWQWVTRIQDEKVIEKWDKPDAFRLFGQIGQFPDPDILPDPNPSEYRTR